ncbi:MAG: FAD-binding protein [Pseudomonadota bacterium]
MSQVQTPHDEDQVRQVITKVREVGASLETRGSGTKAGVGRPAQHAATLSTLGLRGITLYEPTELVISARAGTPLSTIETELAKHNQHLAFEPVNFGSVARPARPGEPTDEPTIGGIVATNASGSRRVFAGAARDHVLGLRAVNGRGEIFKTGGRVMKNVTGYDLCKAMTGTWGTLSVLTEVTLKVLPQAEETATLLVANLPDEMANEVLCSAMALPYEVSGAVHLQQASASRLIDWAGAPDALSGLNGGAITALRIENVSSSVAYRLAQLQQRFSAFGEVTTLDTPASLAFWRAIRDFRFVGKAATPSSANAAKGDGNGALWRISTAPSVGHRVVRMISEFMAVEATYDWSGGLIWLEVPEIADAGAADIRRVVATIGGHATLIRAAPAVRAAVEVFQPLEAGLMRLSRALKSAYDPDAVLNPGRMYADV